MTLAAAQSIVLFAHGARDPQWAEPFERIRDQVRRARPQSQVDLAFLQTMQPSLADAVAEHARRGIGSVLVVPLFFGQGGHLKEDLPRLIQAISASHPGVSLRVTPAAGEVDELVALIARWVVAEFEKTAPDGSRTVSRQTR